MIRREETPDGFLPPRPKDRPRHWGNSNARGEALKASIEGQGRLPGSAAGSTVREQIAGASARARRGAFPSVAQLVRMYRKRWNLSDYALCAMFWDCARVQGTELRAWLEEASK